MRSFLNRDDGLARDHFERVLAGNPPPSVVANVQLFLNSIRARRRWSTYFGFALLPSTQTSAGTRTRIPSSLSPVCPISPSALMKRENRG